MEHCIIIGAMRSGTSTLYYHLAKHPNIGECITKEPEYFSVRNRPACRYIDLWPSNTNEFIKLEASTCYSKAPIFKNVPKNISEYRINPKFIYILRNPFERILAHYNFQPNCNYVTKDFIINTSNYYYQLQQYFKYFKEENFLLIDLDELVDGNKVVNKVCDFLDVDNVLLDTYTWLGVNQNKVKLTLTDNEKTFIFEKLKDDMDHLAALGVDTKKWGF